MSIIDEKVIAAKSGNLDEAKSLMVIMSGTNAIKNQSFKTIITETAQDVDWGVRLGTTVENILPDLREEAKQWQV